MNPRFHVYTNRTRFLVKRQYQPADVLAENEARASAGIFYSSDLYLRIFIHFHDNSKIVQYAHCSIVDIACIQS